MTMSALYPSNVSTRVTSHRIPSYRTTCAGVTSSGQLIVNSTSSCAFTAFAANIAVGDWISARPCSLPFQKAKNDGEGEGDSLSPASSIQFRIGLCPNVFAAAQAKNRRERYNVRGGLVRETGLEFNEQNHLCHILCTQVFLCTICGIFIQFCTVQYSPIASYKG